MRQRPLFHGVSGPFSKGMEANMPACSSADPGNTGGPSARLGTGEIVLPSIEPMWVSFVIIPYCHTM